MTDQLSAESVAGAPAAEVLAGLATTETGLSSAEAAARLARFGPNSLRTHRVSAWAVLRRQLNNAVLALLALTAVVSVFLGDRTQALIIGIILVVSVGLGFVNEYRAEQASAALHSRVRHNAVVRRDGRNCKIDVNQLVPGDVIVTGTPTGAGARFDPPRYLKPGDVIEVEAAMAPDAPLLHARVEPDALVAADALDAPLLERAEELRLHVDRQMGALRRSGQRNDDLTVGDFAERAAVLTLHTNGTRTGLGKRRVIDDERQKRHRARQISQGGAHRRESHRIVGPRRRTEKMHQTLIDRVGLGGLRGKQRGDRFHVFARPLGQQVQHVHREAGALSAVPKMLAQRIEVLLKPLRNTVGNRKVYAPLRSCPEGSRKFTYTSPPPTKQADSGGG